MHALRYLSRDSFAQAPHFLPLSVTYATRPSPSLSTSSFSEILGSWAYCDLNGLLLSFVSGNNSTYWMLLGEGEMRDEKRD